MILGFLIPSASPCEVDDISPYPLKYDATYVPNKLIIELLICEGFSDEVKNYPSPYDINFI
jgi:hypothetical protein